MDSGDTKERSPEKNIPPAEAEAPAADTIVGNLPVSVSTVQAETELLQDDDMTDIVEMDMATDAAPPPATATPSISASVSESEAQVAQESEGVGLATVKTSKTLGSKLDAEMEALSRTQLPRRCKPKESVPTSTMSMKAMAAKFYPDITLTRVGTPEHQLRPESGSTQFYLKDHSFDKPGSSNIQQGPSAPRPPSTQFYIQDHNVESHQKNPPLLTPTPSAASSAEFYIRDHAFKSSVSEAEVNQGKLSEGLTKPPIQKREMTDNECLTVPKKDIKPVGMNQVPMSLNPSESMAEDKTLKPMSEWRNFPIATSTPAPPSSSQLEPQSAKFKAKLAKKVQSEKLRQLVQGVQARSARERERNQRKRKRAQTLQTSKMNLAIKKTLLQSVQAINGSSQEQEKPIALRRQRRVVENRQNRSERLALSPELEACDNILSVLLSSKYEDIAWPFYHPVDADALDLPDYHDIVTQPMDLSTIRKKLHSGKYNTSADFAADVELMLMNCYNYNDHSLPVVAQAVQLENLFDELFQGMPTEEQVHQEQQNEVAHQSNSETETCSETSEQRERVKCYDRERERARRKRFERNRNKWDSSYDTSITSISFNSERPSEIMYKSMDMDFDNCSSDESETEREKKLLCWQDRLNFLRAEEARSKLAKEERQIAEEAEIQRLEAELRDKRAEVKNLKDAMIRAFLEQRFRKDPSAFIHEYGTTLGAGSAVKNTAGNGKASGQDPEEEEIPVKEIKQLAEDINLLSSSEMSAVLHMISTREPKGHKVLSAQDAGNPHTEKVEINYASLSNTALRDLQKFVAICLQFKERPHTSMKEQAERQFQNMKKGIFDDPNAQIENKDKSGGRGGVGGCGKTGYQEQGRDIIQKKRGRGRPPRRRHSDVYASIKSAVSAAGFASKNKKSRH